MDRLLQNTTATVRVTVYLGETATDPSPDAATVTVTRADGTAVVTDAVATNETGGVFAYTLTPTHTALLDTLTLTWTFTLAGSEQQLQTTAEVVGGFLFSIQELRMLDPLSDDTAYTLEKVLAARTMAEQTIEDACGVAFVPRASTETVSGSGNTLLPLSRPRVRNITTAAIDGTELTLTDLRIDDGYAYLPGAWAAGVRNITVTVEHGYDTPPAPIRRAAMLLARWYLVDSPIDDRFTSITNELGTFSTTIPGERGAFTALPEVNAAIQRYKWPTAQIASVSTVPARNLLRTAGYYDDC